jgi:redox-sensitive bicupin YhaK (pirin superfamily)
MPADDGAPPSWGTRPFPREDRSGRFVTLASGSPQDGALPLRADATVSGATLKAGQSIVHPLGVGRYAYLVPSIGVVDVNGTRIQTRDGAAIRDERELRITAIEDAELVLVDTPA